MKRIAWILLIGLWCVSLAMAQIGNFTQRGKATQELKTDGLSIAHPSLPLNSKATITNAKNGKSIEVTVTGRVPASTSRIADLSSGAWQELDLDTNSEITISTTPPPRARAAPPAQPPDEPVIAQATPENPPAEQNNKADYPREEYPVSSAAPYPTPPPPTQRYNPDSDLQRRIAATATATSAYSQPVYTAPPPAPVAPAAPATPPPEKVQPPVIQPQLVVVPSYNITVVPIYQNQQTTTIHQPPPPPPPPAPAYPPPPPVYQPQSAPVCDPIPTQAYPPAPVSAVRVSPGYPDPACTKLYTLQVGAYSTANAANKAESLLKNNGFNVSQDLSKPYYRIVISGVQASTIHALVQRLGAAGVEEVIIR